MSDATTTTTSDSSSQPTATAPQTAASSQVNNDDAAAGGASPSSTGFLASLPAYDALREDPSNSVRRYQNLDLVATPSSSLELGICHLAVMMPFSRVLPQNGKRVPFPHGYQAAVATALALEHLNTGNGTIVPAIANLPERCGIRFTMELVDSEFFQSNAVKATLQVLNRKPGVGRLPTAFIGNTRSPVSMATSVITGLAGYPQFSPYSVTNELNDKSQHPLLGRLIPDSDGHALPIVCFFREVLNVKHLAVVHNNDGYGDAYARAVLKTAQEHTPDLVVEFIDLPVKARPEDYVKAVTFLKSTQYRYFFAPILDDNYAPLMEEAYRQGIAGDGKHNWMFSASIERALPKEYIRDSPIHLATRGISIINVLGGKQGSRTRKLYDASWDRVANNPADIDYLTSLLPQHEGYDMASFVPVALGMKGQVADTLSYDIAVLLGLSACAAAEGNKNATILGPPSVDGTSHYQKTLETQFEGVSGTIALEPSTGSRDPFSAYFDLLNFYFEDDPNNATLVELRSKQSFLFENGTWDQKAPWVFNDGTVWTSGGVMGGDGLNLIPTDLPPIAVNPNYIGPTLRGIGLAIAAAIIVLSIGFSVWSRTHKRAQVVRASQPIFLHILCLGVFLMGAGLIPLSFDDEIASAENCSRACMAVPWLLCVGFAIAFSALLAKTWRVNKIFYNPTMRRLRVAPRDVMKPLFVSLAANTIILIVWSTVSPLEWQRTVVALDIFDRVVESHGSCRSPGENGVYFVVGLGLVNLGVLLLAVYQAYVARNIAMEFSESEYIAKALYTTMLVSLVAIPVMVIVTDEPRASYFAMVSVVTVLCASVLLFIFVPKILYNHQKGPEQQKARASRAIRSFASNPNGSGPFTSTGGSNPFSSTGHNHSSVDSMAPLSDSDFEEGANIIYHPNMRQKLQDEVATLKRRIKQLETKARRKELELEHAPPQQPQNPESEALTKKLPYYEVSLADNDAKDIENEHESSEEVKSA